MKKAIITVLGKDRTGIIAAVSGRLAVYDVNILDITQTILQDYFTMIMLVDVDTANIPFDEIKSGLIQLSEELGMEIRIQHEEIFNSMHRI